MCISTQHEHNVSVKFVLLHNYSVVSTNFNAVKPEYRAKRLITP